MRLNELVDNEGARLPPPIPEESIDTKALIKDGALPFIDDSCGGCASTEAKAGVAAAFDTEEPDAAAAATAAAAAADEVVIAEYIGYMTPGAPER